MFGGTKLRLVDDWHQAWRWSSIRFLAVGGVVQTSLLSFPGALQQYLPPKVLSGLAMFALFCLIGGGVGRITTIEPKKDDDDVQHHEHI